MRTSTAGFREAGSFIAGVLIGLSMVVMVFAMMAVETNHLQVFFAFGWPIVLVLGIMLQIVISRQNPGYV